MIPEWDSDGRKRKGKPGKHWIDRAKRIMISQHLTKEDAEDRDCGGARFLWYKIRLLNCQKLSII